VDDPRDAVFANDTLDEALFDDVPDHELNMR
jgi:hypothetical protein